MAADLAFSMTTTRLRWRAMLLAGTVLLLSLLSATAARAEVLVIAHPDNDTISLNHHELQAIYLKRRPTWSNGVKIKLAMLAEKGPRQEFCRTYLGKSITQLERHWRRQLYTGRALPPAALQTSAEVINFVRTTPGALGFISSQPHPQGVVVVTITP